MLNKPICILLMAGDQLEQYHTSLVDLFHMQDMYTSC